MHFTLATIAAVASLVAAVPLKNAAADHNAANDGPQVSQWTLQQFQRTCSPHPAPTTCHYSFLINENNAQAATACAFDTTGQYPYQGDYTANCGDNGVYLIGTHYNTTFSGTDVSVQRTDSNLIAYFAYTDAELQDEGVQPDQTQPTYSNAGQ